MSANLENSALAQDWKRSLFIPIPKKGNTKECSNYHTVALISHASKVMLKILQDRLQQYVKHELPDVQAGFSKGRGTRVQISNICWKIEKARKSRKTSISALLVPPKPLTMWITINCGKFWKRWEYQSTFLASWEICMQVKNSTAARTRHGTMDCFQIGKGVRQDCILPLCLFNIYAESIMQNFRLDEVQTGIKIARRNINNLRYADNTTLMAESEEELKSLLMKVKEESEKVGLNINIQKTKIMAYGPITS